MPLAMFSDSDDSESTELPTWKPSVIVILDYNFYFNITIFNIIYVS